MHWFFLYNKSVCKYVYNYIKILEGDILKKNLSLILIFALIISTMSISFADIGNMTDTEVAEVLKEINIFQGNGVSFDLDSKLKRSEAATLVVKILGMNNNVLNNKAKYLPGNFKDVAKDDWFAPYVGYCSENGIIKGFPDGTFKPNDYITEKAFTQLILGVLGYTSGTDFNWDDIYTRSLDYGLHTDFSYAFKSEDNSDFYRKDAIRIIYNSLDKKVKNQEFTTIERLIRTGITTENTAEKLQLLKTDKLATSISEIEVASTTSLKVTMNERINIEKDDVEILLKDRVIKLSSVNIINNVIDITSSEELLKPNRYTLVLNNISDNDGYKSDTLSKDFDGAVKPLIESPEFKISGIDVISDKVIKVYFTHPITDDAKEVLLYDIYRNGELFIRGSYKSLFVEKLDYNEYGVYLKSLNDTFSPDAQYEIKIRGDLKSQYSSYLRNGEGDSAKFSGTMKQLDGFLLSDSHFYEKNMITVQFSGSADLDTALDTHNYKLKNLRTNTSINPIKVYKDLENTNNGSVFILKFNSINSTDEYQLTVTDIKDTFETQTLKDQVSDIGNPIEDVTSVELTYSEAVDRSTIVLHFNRPLAEMSTNANITIDKNISIRNKILSDDQRSIKIILNKTKYLSSDEEYLVKINSGLVDYLGRTQKYLISESVTGNSDITNDVRIDYCNFISDNLIMVKYDTDVRSLDLTNLDTYEFMFKSGNIERTLFPTSILKIDSKTLILGYDYSLGEGELSVIAKDVYEYSGQFKYSKIEAKVANYK